jgi:hypothetical protein
MARLQFCDLKKDSLWELRGEIVLNSIYTNDYRNSFGFAPKSVQDFFDGYMEYLYELANEDYGMNQPDIDSVIEEYDNPDNLMDWYWNFTDFSWVEYEPEWTDEDEEDYENEWNG